LGLLNYGRGVGSCRSLLLVAVPTTEVTVKGTMTEKLNGSNSKGIYDGTNQKVDGEEDEKE